MNNEFFVWAEPLFLDDPALRDYYLSGQLPPNPDFDLILAFYWKCYELELNAGLLDGAQIEIWYN